MQSVLICGSTSFVANGLYEKLKLNGFKVDCFTRGEEAKNQDFITGNITEITSNKFLSLEYDVVINFIILKDKNVQDNIEFIKSVVDLCKIKKVKKLIHFSSIMVYENNEPYINESTEIEKNTYKVGYGEIKIEVDKYLMSLIDLPFTISLVRPGYVIAENRPCPFVKRLPLGISIIKGDKNSKQPIVTRDIIHLALINIVKFDIQELVYLFVPNNQMTKYAYSKKQFGGFILTLPEWLILGASKFLLNLKLINKTLYVRIEGMYIKSIYDSSKTEQKLNVIF